MVPTPPASKPKFLYHSIAIEVVAIKHTRPQQSALDYLKIKMHERRICKLDNIYINIREVADPVPALPWNRSKLDAFEAAYRKIKDPYPEDRYLKLFVCYITGPYMEPDCASLAGLKYGETSFMIVRTGCGDDIEDSTLLHEFGHILDFDFECRGEEPVNEDRPSHCNNEECVMYWRITGGRKDFDKRCRRDIRKLVRAR